MLWCPTCDMRTDTTETDRCPFCSETLVAAQEESDNRGLNLSFGIFKCDNCGEIYTLNNSLDRCPECGELHDTGDRRVEARRKAFADGLELLQRSLEETHGLAFADKGERLTAREYRDCHLRILQLLEDRLAGISGSMDRGDWSNPEKTESVAAWEDGQTILLGAIDDYDELKRSLPPVNLVSHQRVFARAVFLFCSFGLEFFQALVAPSLDVARSRQRVGQEALDKAGELLSEARRHLEAGEKLVDAGSAGLTQVEEERESLPIAFPEIAEAVSRDPAVGRPLLPFVLVSMSTQDKARRVRRVGVVDHTLRNASDPGSLWRDAPDAFVVQFARSLAQLRIQHSRIVDASSRAIDVASVETLMDAISKLVEGPIKRLGSILIAALDATPPELKGWGRVQVRLNSDLPELLKGFDPLLRNAEAHNDYEIVGNRVFVNHTPPGKNSAPLTDDFGFDDVGSSALVVLEIALGAVLGFVSWAEQAAPVSFRRAFNRAWLAS